MIDIVFGVNIVEIVTSGLYPNALDIFREYVQNACDAIDDATKADILSEGGGEITITIDKKARRITVEDNGIGIPSGAKNFVRIMSSIGNSDKKLATDRGFRGIGRLGGLAYCKTLIFSTKVAGEKKISTLTINAEKLRETFFSKNKYLAEQVLSANMIFSTQDADDVAEHFFRVEMLDINETNSDLLDVAKIREYLSFVAPVTYSPQFYYQTEIYKHAEALDFKITEYKIYVWDNSGGEPVVKNYKTNLKTRMGKDEIFDLEFRDFYDGEQLIAWCWVGLSNFKGVIDQTSGTADNMMRGIRLRAGNIQIGDAEVFKHLFNERRGTNYFIGEVHTVDTNLRPNSRRDYFEENEACNTLEAELKKYFLELDKIYHAASNIRSVYKTVNAPVVAEEEFQQGHSTCKNRVELDAELDKLNKAAAIARKKIESARQEAEQNPTFALSRVVLRMTDEKLFTPPRSTFRSRLINQSNFRPFIGAKIYASFIMKFGRSFSATRRSAARNFSTRLTRSLPNESPRIADRAELQEQIYSVKLDETCNVFSDNLWRRRAVFQGRLKTFCRAVVVGGIFSRGGRQ